jgi:ATP-dependent Zn protease
MDQQQKKQAQFSGAYLLLALAALLLIHGIVARRTAPKAVPMSEMLQQVRDGKRICVMFGGRVAEELVCGDISTGAHDDLARATETARQMVAAAKA